MSTASVVLAAACSAHMTLAQCASVLSPVLRQWRVFLTNPYLRANDRYLLAKRIVRMFLNVL